MLGLFLSDPAPRGKHTGNSAGVFSRSSSEDLGNNHSYSHSDSILNRMIENHCDHYWISKCSFQKRECTVMPSLSCPTEDRPSKIPTILPSLIA